MSDAPRGEHPLGAALRHEFRDPALLEAALTHPSTGGGVAARHYERLEFLGDRVLGLVVAELLFQRFPKETEGGLSRRLHALVRKEALSDVAAAIGLAGHMISCPSTPDAITSSVLADACEGVIAALYLDGGLDAAKRFIHRHWEALIEQDRRMSKDAKTALQEWAQGRGRPAPTYAVVAQNGPAHAPTFTVRACLDDELGESGQGPSRRAAEQAAAACLLAKVREA